MEKLLASCLYYEKAKNGFKFCIKLIDKFYYLNGKVCKTENKKLPIWIFKKQEEQSNKNFYGYSHVKDVNSVLIKTYLTRKVPYNYFKESNYSDARKLYFIDGFYYNVEILKQIENQVNSVSFIKKRYTSEN